MTSPPGSFQAYKLAILQAELMTGLFDLDSKIAILLVIVHYNIAKQNTFISDRQLRCSLQVSS